MKKNIIIFLLSLFIIPCIAQDDDLIQLSGITKNESNEILPFVHIVVLNKWKGTYSDLDGLYNIVSHKGDTIIFSCVGYKTQVIITPTESQEMIKASDIYMIKDTISIEQVIILPWNTYEEFKQAFKTVELAETDADRAQRNVEIIKAQILANYTYDVTPSMAFRNTMNQQYSSNYAKGQYPTLSLTNPFKWAQFFEALREGKFKNPKNKE